MLILAVLLIHIAVGPGMRTLIALDQAINTLIWSAAEGWGHADETLSARAWRLGSRYPATWGVLRVAIDALLFFDPDHCFTSYLAERRRKHFPAEYRR